MTTAGFDTIKTGIVIKVNLRESTAETARLGLEVELSQPTERIDEAYATSTEAYTGTTEVRSQGVYLVGELQRHSTTHDQRWGLSNLTSTQQESGVIQIWARAIRVN